MAGLDISSFDLYLLAVALCGGDESILILLIGLTAEKILYYEIWSIISSNPRKNCIKRMERAVKILNFGIFQFIGEILVKESPIPPISV